MKIVNYLFFTALLFIFSSAHAQIITTLAGGATGVGTGDEGPATACQLASPISIVLDASGNYYITDRDENRIRKVNTSGMITTIAGTGLAGFVGDNGPATSAKIHAPYGIAIDATGNIYFSDDENNRIRKIDTEGIITTIAGNGASGYSGDNIQATTAAIYAPGGIAIDNSGNMYIADSYNQRIRKIDPSGIITTIAGTGTPGYNGDEIAATNAQLNYPNYVSLDLAGNIYIADYYNNKIRKIDASGIIHTIAGNGTLGYSGDNNLATAAQLNKPCGVYADKWGNIYIGDTYNNVIRKVNPSGIITTIAGDGTEGYGGDNGPATLAELALPVGVTTDNGGNIYISDGGNERVRYIKSTVFVPQINTEGAVKIYPNPCIGNFVISISSALDEPVEVKIADVLGNVIKTFSIVTNKPNNISLTVPDGMYLVIAATQTQAWTKRIIVAK